MSNRAIRGFFPKVNAVHGNFHFTMELKANGCMPFLDVLVERCKSGTAMRTHRKPTHTGLYSNLSSFVP